MDNIKSTLAIIPCTKAKIWDMLPELGPTQAKDVYINPFHALAREYVNLFTPHWVILSAKYGFLFPNDYIEKTYDITFDREDDPYITVEELKAQVIQKKLQNYTDLLIICNDRYIHKIKQTFKINAVKIHTPLMDIEDDMEGILRLNKCLRAERAKHVVEFN